MPFEGMNFGLARPTIQIENPMDVAMKGLAMQGQQQQQQLQGLQIQAQTQAMQRAGQTRQAVANSGGDMSTAIKAAMDSGDWETADKMSTALRAQQAAKQSLQKSYLESNDLEQRQMKGLVQTVGSQAQAVSQIKDPVEKWNAWQQTLQTLPQQLAPNPTDTPKMQALKQSMIQQMGQESTGLMQMRSPTDLDALLNKHVDDAKTHEDWMKEASEAAANGKVMGVHADPNNNAFGIRADGTSVQIKDENGNPQKMKPAAGAVVQVNPSGHADVAQASSRAQDIADGNVQVPKQTRGDQTALQDVADAKKIMQARGEDPINLNGKYAVVHQGQMSFAPGKPNANVIGAVNTAADHTNNILLPAAKALNNGDFTGANALLNKIGIAFGKNEATNFDSVATFLSTEVAKVANGGTAPTLAEIAEARKMFPVNGSNAQIQGAVDIANKIMRGKLNSVELQHENAYGGKSITDRNLLTDEAIKVFGKFGKQAAPSNPGAGKPISSDKLSPEQAAKLPSGTQFYALDGTLHTRN